MLTAAITGVPLAKSAMTTDMPLFSVVPPRNASAALASGTYNQVMSYTTM